MYPSLVLVPGLWRLCAGTTEDRFVRSMQPQTRPRQTDTHGVSVMHHPTARCVRLNTLRIHDVVGSGKPQNGHLGASTIAFIPWGWAALLTACQRRRTRHRGQRTKRHKPTKAGIASANPVNSTQGPTGRLMSTRPEATASSIMDPTMSSANAKAIAL